MVSAKLLAFTIIACYFHNVNSQCTKNFASGPIPNNLNYANTFNNPNPGYGMGQLAYNPNVNGITAGIQAPGNFGGLGNGNIAIAGELPVAGNTLVSGAVPVLGAVSFGGTVPAGGVVSIAGTYSCGCNFS